MSWTAHIFLSAIFLIVAIWWIAARVIEKRQRARWCREAGCGGIGGTHVQPSSAGSSGIVIIEELEL
jgi:hypothetical protein